MNAPWAAIGVASVAVPASVPFTYRVMAPVLASYEPARNVQVPAVAAALDSAEASDGLAVSVSGRANCQSPLVAS